MSLADPTPLSNSSNPSLNEKVSASRMSGRLGDTTPRADDGTEISKKESKTKKRTLFGLGKKKSSDGHETPKESSRTGSNTSPTLSRDMSKMSSTTRSTTSPTLSDQGFILPSSPGRGLSSSPRMSSPAGSQIFERDVQDSVSMMPNSPAIPSHIQTENYIPPVLDASSEAITDNHLDPDNVEIITHTSHLPASVTVTGAAPNMTYEQMAASWAEELASFGDRGVADDASNYGSFDTNDVRRLSFISFADVVQAEQVAHGTAGSRDSIHLAGLTSFAPVNRSPSPIRSPVSSQGPGTSPPTSKSGSMKGFDISMKGLDMSPTRKPLASPTSPHHNMPVVSGEISIETMSQALRRTGSADLSAARSLPTSPIEGPSR